MLLQSICNCHSVLQLTLPHPLGGVWQSCSWSWLDSCLRLTDCCPGPPWYRQCKAGFSREADAKMGLDMPKICWGRCRWRDKGGESRGGRESSDHDGNTGLTPEKGGLGGEKVSHPRWGTDLVLHWLHGLGKKLCRLQSYFSWGL